MHTNPKNPVIGDRALADRAEDVARLGAAIIRTLQGAGIAACGKHFPGHGDTGTDSHFELPLLDHPPDRLEAVELVPFKAAIAAGVASIMTAHILIPSLDETRPGTLSPRDRGRPAEEEAWLRRARAQRRSRDEGHQRTLRPQRGDGAGDRGRLRRRADVRAAARRRRWRRSRRSSTPSRKGELPLKRVEDAMARHRRVKERFLAPPRPRPATGAALRAILGRDEHQAVAAEMARFA